MSKGKLNSIQDPLGQQKTDAANIGLQNYRTASSNVPGLQQYVNSNFGQTPTETLSKLDPLFQSVYGSVQGDVTGKGGPFSSLMNNLLGNFDTQATRSTAQQNQQLANMGMLGSGPGSAVQAFNAGNLAQQRGLIGAQTTVDELNMANALSNALMGYNQQQGFSNPITALQQIGALSSPPNFQDVSNTYYPSSPSIGQTIGSMALPGLIDAGMAAASGGASLLPGMIGNFLNPSNASRFPNVAYQSPGLNSFNANMPGLTFSSL